jgi:hypothetical protein
VLIDKIVSQRAFLAGFGISSAEPFQSPTGMLSYGWFQRYEGYERMTQYIFR